MAAGARVAPKSANPPSDLPQPRRKAKEAPIRATDRISLFIAKLKQIGGAQRRRRQGVVRARRRAKAPARGVRGKVWALATAEIRYLKKFYQLRYVRRILTDYRNAVRDAYGDHPVLDYLRPSAADQEIVAEVYRKQVHQDHLQLQAINPDSFLDVAMRAIIMAKDVYILAGLLLLTGRRPAELLWSGKFERVKGNDYALMFSGQLKTRESEFAQTGPYEIPILAHADEVLNAIERMRLGNAFSKASDVNRAKGKGIATAVDWVYGTLDVGTAREIRKVYATIAYASLETKDISLVAYTARILGHATTDLQTALSYIAYYIEGTYHEAHREVARSEAEILGDLLRLREVQTSDLARGQIDQRIAQLRVIVPKRVRDRVKATPVTEPALSAEAARTREALRTLSPAQLRLLCELSVGKSKANQMTQSGQTRILRRLESAGIITTKPRPRSTIVDVELTPFGASIASLATR